MKLRNAILTIAVLSSCAIADATVIMDQIGPSSEFTRHTNAWASQQFESDLSAFDVAMIDDFVVSDERHLTSVEAVVSMFNSFGESTLHSVLGWRVEIYSSPVAARTNLDGDVASYFVAPPSAQIDTNWFPQNVGAGKVTLPVAIGLAASGTFWIGVIPVLSYSTSGQIGIRDSEFQGSPGNGNNIQVNPGGGFALPGNWMSRNGNSAYRITAVPEPATACASALGLVALLFRSRRHS